jgi:threonylcarbamoyladenosine tRNA methylthiotransferase MtaB
MMRGLSVKTPLFYESQLGSTRTVLLKAKIKGYIHGFTENYVKVKNSVESELVNTLHEINLTTIDTDGSVRMGLLR